MINHLLRENFTSMNTLPRILAYSRRYWDKLAISLVTASLFGITSAIPAYLLRQTIDEIFVKQYNYLIIPFIVCFVLVFAGKALFMYLTGYYMNWVGTKVVNDIRYDLFKNVMHQPLSFFQHTTTGELMSHFLHDIQMIQQGASLAIKDGIRSFFEALCLIGFAFFQNWQLALLLIIVGPIIGFVIKKMGSARKKASTIIQKQMGSISSMLQEAIIGIREIKAFNGEEAETQRFAEHLNRCFYSIMHNVHIESLAPALIEIIAVGGGCVVFYVAVQQVLTGVLTAGQLTALVAAILLSYQPLKKIVAVYSDVHYSLAAADRVFVVMDTVHPLTENRSFTLTSCQDVIQFTNVSFGYNETLVLHDATLAIKHGQRIGLIGPSGSGKSTLCDLLLGFIAPTSGSITIDGQDISHVSFSSLRSHIGYVGQRTFLFNDTILNNILYAKPGATFDEVIAACKSAHADEFIQKLPAGYQTIVGENGTLLSGGQKQRLTIARALLKDPEILIFDEATSALDQESESLIKEAIDALHGKKTLIIVSHRPQMLENADKIFALREHKLVEMNQSHMQISNKDLIHLLN